MKKTKHIHFVGVKGVGMAPLAIIAKEAGFTVSCCDIAEEFITDKALRKAGIYPLVGFSKDHIQNVDLIITTGAHGGFDNVEVKAARLQNIKVLTQGEAVGVFMDGKIFGRSLSGISIAGCHGKTTTTAFVSTVFRELGQDPSFVVGTGNVSCLGSPGHYGKGKYFIAEADEYATEPVYDKKPKFLWQYPKIAIFTNIEYDHPDLYRSIDDIRHSFLQFTKNFAKEGLLITYGDDPQVGKLLKQYSGYVITYGFSDKNNFVIKNISVSEGQTFFWVDARGTSLGEFRVSLSGEHNVLNSMGAIIAAFEEGFNMEQIKKALIKFTGTQRRLEYIGATIYGALVFDDYAHHPTEIKKTLKTIRQVYPKRKIICIFQPHTYSRTKILFEEFTHSFSEANIVMLENIYPSLRELPDKTVSAERLVESMSKFHGSVMFLPEATDVVEYINKKAYGRDFIIVTMGAGDVYKIGRELTTSS